MAIKMVRYILRTAEIYFIYLIFTVQSAIINTIYIHCRQGIKELFKIVCSRNALSHQWNVFSCYLPKVMLHTKSDLILDMCLLWTKPPTSVSTASVSVYTVDK